MHRILDSLYNLHLSKYNVLCNNGISDELEITWTTNEFLYTLYYYDQADNLIKTIPPEGVHVITNSDDLEDIIQYRKNIARYDTIQPGFIWPRHTMATNYRYNSLNQIVGSYHPDHDSTALVMYDILSRPVISQNGKQKTMGNFYSYTLFDPIGRIIQVGQLDGGASAITPEMVKDATTLSNYINSSSRMEVTKTYYDRFIFYTSSQVNLRNRIADITYSDYYTTDPLDYQSASHFSYDIHGNVKNLQQEIKELNYLNGGLFTLDYEYDLISGNVNKVYYQKGRADQFAHRYRYDADNRLTHVYTSGIVGDYNPLIERLEAKYFYLPHGPLARVELGKKSIQGLDYAYTLQGWLKDINGYRNDISSTNVYDIGKDGSATNFTNKRFGKDGFATMLQYYTGDYTPISGNNYFNLGSPNSVGLYNGNISALSLGIDTLNPMLKSFRYDKLNRIKMMESAYLSNNIWGVLSNRFGTEYSYDFNGNITNLSRRDETATLLHDIGYTYEQDRNRLRGIEVNGTEIRSSSYHYDALGNLITDDIEEINVDWNVIGKVKFVQTPNNRLNFAYNPFGQRQIKRTDNDTTYYVHDATGNVMGIYVKDDLTLTTQERPIYGSARLGIMNKVVVFNLTGGLVSKSTSTIGIKEYELSDHLGNVSVVILDRKIFDGDKFAATSVSRTDYYPFGYPIASRSFSLEQYRYGFNGKEYDNEIYNASNFQDYGMRMYDTRIARFWGVDPLKSDYPMLTPFQFASNSPIWAIDLDGMEAWPVKNDYEASQEDFESMVNSIYTGFISNNKKAPVITDCAKFQFYILLKYYEKAGIQFVFKGKDDNVYDSHAKDASGKYKYKDFDSFFNAAKHGVSSYAFLYKLDLIRQKNSEEEVKSGDLLIHYSKYYKHVEGAVKIGEDYFLFYGSGNDHDSFCESCYINSFPTSKEYIQYSAVRYTWKFIDSLPKKSKEGNQNNENLKRKPYE